MTRSPNVATALGVLLIVPALALALHATAIRPLAWADRPVTEWQPVGGNRFASPLGTSWMSRREVGESPAILLEDGVALQCPDTAGELIAEKGRGRYLIADGFVYAASSDNSDPRTNGRRYALRWPAPPPTAIVAAAGVAALAGLAVLLFAWRAALGRLVMDPPLTLCLLIVIVPAVIHRAWFFIQVPLVDIQFDTATYYAPARDLLSGHWPHFEVRPPGFPLLLAATLGATHSLIAVVAVQTLLTIASAYVLVYAVYRLHRPAALWVAAAMAVHVTGFWTLQFDTAILSESLYTSAVIFSVGFLVLAFATGHAAVYAAASMAIAGAVLTRPAGLFLVVPYALTLAYLAWNHRPWRQMAAFGLPFVALMLSTSVYNHVMARAFAVTAWGEANLLGVTSRVWEPDAAYPPAINDAIARIQGIVGMSPEERAVVESSWSPERLAPIFAKGYSEPVLAIARALGGDYVGSRPWIRRIAFDAIRRRPLVYAKFVSTMSYMFFIHNIGWRADFADYVNVRALHILTDAARIERQSRPDEIELVSTYFNPRAVGISTNDPCIGPDRVGRLVPSTWLRLHRLTQRARDLVGARVVWVAAYGMVLLAAIAVLARSRGRHDPAFLVMVIGLFPIGAGAIVCLVEVGADRYSYPTEFAYYLVVAMAPLLWTGRVRA